VILWHLGATTLAVRYAFGDPAMDLRWVMLGSLLPDLIDKPVGSVLCHSHFGAHRLYGHTLLLPALVLGAALVLTRRRSRARKAMIVLVVGWLLHLVLDGVWTEPGSVLWPLFGWSFPETDPSALLPLLRSMVRSPTVWLGEGVGAAYLLYLARAHLGTGEARSAFLRRGVIALRSR